MTHLLDNFEQPRIPRLFPSVNYGRLDKTTTRGRQQIMENTHGLLSGMHILVVEDEHDTRELLRFLLDREGAKVEVASTVTGAFDLIAARSPDVIVADIGMPDYNGYALVARLRSQDKETGRTTPIIALTAYATPTDRDTALASGFNAYLSKPFEPAELVSTIRDLHHPYPSNHAA
jgi:CheY-like chemotaxis protein